MWTTALNILEALSNSLGEGTIIQSSRRLSYLNEGMKYYYSRHPFRFRIKSYDLTINEETTDYSLSSISDFDPDFGIDRIESTTGEKVDPKYYSLINDGLKLRFDENNIPSSGIYKVYYYSSWVNVSNASATLNVPIPDKHHTPIITYLSSLVFKSKKQRNDWRNAILDFQEQLEDVISSEAERRETTDAVRQFKGGKDLYL